MTAKPASNAPQAPISPKDLATQLNSDPKTVRKFLRSIVDIDNRPGKGARWTIDAALVPTLAERFAAWKTNKAKVLDASMLKSDDAS